MVSESTLTVMLVANVALIVVALAVGGGVAWWVLKNRDQLFSEEMKFRPKR